MKKTLSVIIAFVLLLALFAFAACEIWQNPGDMLGGGQHGEVAEEVDSTEMNGVTDTVKGKTDLSELASDTSPSEDAKQIAATPDIVEISSTGTYVFEGEYGGIILTKKNLVVHLFFNGVTINTVNGIAINGNEKSNENITITLNANTVNNVENSGLNAKGKEVNAIHVDGSLSINGKGTLNVTSTSKSAIKASGEIKIVDASINLSAANHAIAGASVAAANCAINVSAAGKDGINVECDGATEFRTSDGYVALKNVDYTCNVEGDGIQANTVVYIDGGSYNITTNGKFVSDTTANREEYGLVADDFKFIKSGNDYKRIASDERTSGTKYALTQGCKGIKVSEIEYTDANDNDVTVTDGDYLIAIVSGTFVINSTDDAIHTNSGSVLISGGTFELATYDDAITSDDLTKITGGNITVTKSYEGIEGAYVEISGGTIDIVSSDDGINAASDDKSVTPHIIISGGTVTVNASGDGIDSNGSILISGGTVTVHGPTSGGDAGLDADKGIVVTGGTLFASSTLGMVETPSTNSTQYVVSYANKSTISAGSVVSLRDSKGNVLITVTTLKDCQSIILSSAELQKGSTYYIYGGDTQITSFTISSIITTIGSQSNFPGGPGSSGGPGGPGGR